MTTNHIKTGDLITFRAVTRSGLRTAERRVTSFWDGNPTVRLFHGWNDFIVHRGEIIAVNGRPVTFSGGALKWA